MTVQQHTKDENQTANANDGIEDDGACFRPDLMPKIYALKLEGDCMVPHFRAGHFAVLSPLVPYTPGDFVCLFFKHRLPENHNSNILLKRLVLAPWPGYQFGGTMRGDVTPIVIAEQLNPKLQFRIDCNDLLAVHKVIGSYEPGQQQTVNISDADARLVYGHPDAA